MGNPHVIAIPYPAQGHVIPMLELSQWLIKQGIKVTLVNTEFIHQRVVQSLSNSDNIRELVDIVSISDGLEPWEDRNDLGRVTEAMFKVMPVKLEALIEEINGKGGAKITCVVADWNMGWALEVAERMRLRRAAFWPAAATVLALSFNIPKLVSDGIIDSDGRPLKNHSIQLSPTMPLMNPMQFLWVTVGDPATQKIVYNIMIKNNSFSKFAEYIICNSSDDLESGALSLFPDIRPVGPLLATNRLGKPVGNFWPEDSGCMAWLDQQPPDSVIYIAFGSFTVFDQKQFTELALGLELTNRPFLWVVRQDMATIVDKWYPKGYTDRVLKRGRIVGWAPQQQVLSHPSVACFMSHCGWNSTIEGVGNGVPFLCWPYYADQFLNQTYICDEWKVGLGLNRDESGIVRQGEIKDKVECLLSDKKFKERVLNLQTKTMDGFRGGGSGKSLNDFIEWIKKN